MRYKISKTDVINPDVQSSEWLNADVGKVECQRWKEFYQPIDVTFKMLRGPEGTSVLMHTNEKNLRAECTEQNGMVCYDSCMEFFFKPDVHDVNFLNFELNPAGILHLGLGNGRHGRTLIDCDRSIFSIESVAEDGNWTLKFYIPDSFLLKHFEKISPVCKANFYKCGEHTGHSHFISWAEVEVEEPDFHVPDFFGKLEF